MSINLTLFGQMITFALFVWFTMKFVWPHIESAMKERQLKITQGLDAAEQAKRDVDFAQHKAMDIIKEAKQQALVMLEGSNKRAFEIVEAAKEQARVEGIRLIEHAKTEIDKQANSVRRELSHHVGALALEMSEKILKRSINKDVHRDLLNAVVEEI